jgi:hypothetical protein
MNFTSQQHYTHEITHGFTPGSLDSCTQTLEQNKVSQICPCRLSTASGVLAGGKVRGGDGLVPHDLQRLLIMMGVMCLKGTSGARPATSNGGGRVGASSFPARGWRTRGNKARMSTGEVRGCFPPTQFGQK